MVELGDDLRKVQVQKISDFLKSPRNVMAESQEDYRSLETQSVLNINDFLCSEYTQIATRGGNSLSHLVLVCSLTHSMPHRAVAASI